MDNESNGKPKTSDQAMTPTDTKAPAADFDDLFQPAGAPPPDVAVPITSRAENDR